MSLLETAVVAIHLLFAGVWTGSVVFVARSILPLAVAGDLNAGPLDAIAGSLRTISRISAVVLLLTGGHMAGTGYTVDSLVTSTAGRLVVAMVVLWLALAALVEIAAGRLADGATQSKVREPARRARRPLQAAALVAVLLLVDGGLLAAGI